MPGPTSDRRAELVALGHALQRRRVERGLTPAQLAEVSGVSRATIVNVENGSYTNSGISILIDIAHALRVRLADVLAEVEVEPET